MCACSASRWRAPQYADSLMTLHTPLVLLRCIAKTDVSGRYRVTGCLDLQVEALVCDDTRRADILVTAQRHRVIVEADGPWHFVRAPDGSIVQQDGTTALRDHLFRGAGYEVLSVRVEDMTPSDFHTPRLRRWLRSELQDVGLACGTTPAQVWLA
jgi:hypothetical protein